MNISTPNELNRLTDEKLLELRLCDLPLQIEKTWLSECLHQLHQELGQKGICFKPRAYLTDEWLTPEGQPIIGIPFYLAHPALIRLELKIMYQAEGGTREECMKLLRHETGHALCYAYGLNRRKSWREVFGESSEEYRDTYKFRPYSKNYVRHLDHYYAQFHPDEDFSETFAVWLTPGLDWRSAYRGWPALRKLNFTDRLMSSIQNKPPKIAKGKPFWKASTSRLRLSNYYRRKRKSQAEDLPDFHDPNLMEIFALKPEAAKGADTAAKLIRNHRRLLREDLARWTGEKRYTVSELISKVYDRCKDLNLYCRHSEAQSLAELTVYLTTLLMNYRYTGWFGGEKQS